MCRFTPGTRVGKKRQHVVRKYGVVEFKGGRRTEASSLQPDPSELDAGRGRLERQDPTPVLRPDHAGGRVHLHNVLMRPARRLLQPSGAQRFWGSNR